MHVRKSLDKIKDGIVSKLIRYLETSIPPQAASKLYVEAYAEVINIADKLSQPQEAYKMYVQTLKERLLEERKKQAETGEILLATYLKSWENYKILVFWMYKVFLYLDKYYIKNQKKDHTSAVNYLACEGLVQFQKELFLPLATRLKETILTLIHRERDGLEVDMDPVKYVLMSFVQVGLCDVEIVKVRDDVRSEDAIMWKGTTNYLHYETQFETDFLQETRSYYQAKTKAWIAEMTCPQYLAQAYQTLEEEKRRADKYLDGKTGPLLLATVEQEVISEHAATIVDMPETGALDLLKNDRKKDLALMFKVFKRVEFSLKHITSKLSAYIETRGSSLVSDSELQADSYQFTKSLLRLKSDIDHLLESCFESHSLFQRCRDSAFQKFLNLNKNSALHISTYIDELMRIEFRGMQESDVESRINAVISVVVCLADRDVFITHYTHLLSYRLLNEKSVSDEAEQIMIKKLALECGHSMVRRIISMFQDINLSRQLNAEYQRLTCSSLLTVQVLKTGCWPQQKKLECPIPEELRINARSFEEFYVSKHSGRSLRWLMGYGQMELTTLFTPRRYILVVSPPQAFILLLFNSSVSLTFNQLQQATHLSVPVLTSHLLKLFNPKHRILLKPSKGKTLSDTDSISLNKEFSSATVRIGLVPSVKLDKPEDKEQEDIEVTNARKFVLESVLVRVMKSRRTIPHSELIAEVVKQVASFKAQPTQIKTEIESLIQREYIARSEQDSSIYIYLP